MKYVSITGSHLTASPNSAHLPLWGSSEMPKAYTADGRPPFSVGDLSKSDGPDYGPHKHGGDHTTGIGMDIRPIRTDGKNLPIRYYEQGYDREATQRAVDALWASGGVTQILFNDPEVRGVTPYRVNKNDDSHDFHLHVRMDPNYRRPPGR